MTRATRPLISRLALGASFGFLAAAIAVSWLLGSFAVTWGLVFAGISSIGVSQFLDRRRGDSSSSPYQGDEEDEDPLERVRFMIAQFYGFRNQNARVAGWFIEELLTPSEHCPSCGGFWFDGCDH